MERKLAALPGQAESRLSKAALGQWLGEQQRLGHPPPAWLELYDALLEERGPDGKARWDWRKALFIAWSCVPRAQREPKTVQELANMLGVRPSTVRKWRSQDPEITERISAAPRRMLLEHVADVYAALVEVATTPDPRAFQDRRLFLELAGDYKPSAAVSLDGRMDLDGQMDVTHDISKLTEDQLRDLAAIAEALGAAG